MLSFYRLLVAPLTVILLPVAALFNRKIRLGLQMRRRPRPHPEWKSPPVWIHAASGEFEYAKSVIRELKAAHPETPILVTYFSPTYARNVESFPGVDFAQPLPLDLPGPCASFLRRHRPRVLLLARTDFWPEMLAQTRRRGIPVAVFSYTQKANLGFWARLATRWRLSACDEIFVVSGEDRRAIEALLPAAPVRSTGDTRYDQVRFRLDHPKELPLATRPAADRPCLVAGSTWPEDEAVLLAALTPMLKERRLRLMLVPHELDHVKDLADQCAAQGLRSRYFSDRTSWEDAEVLIVDQIGWLAELYAWGQLAFVGGSYRRSVHSVMEALGAGLPVVVGPWHHNNREAIEFQSVYVGRVPAVTSAGGPSEFAAAVRNLLDQDLNKMRAQLTREFDQRLGASRIIQAWVAGLPKAPPA